MLLAALGAGLASAACAIVASAYIGLSWAAVLTPVPVLWAAMRPWARERGAALAVGAGTAPFWILTHAWMVDVTALGVYPLIAILCGFVALATWLAARGPSGGWWAVASAGTAWAAVEWLRGEIACGGYAWHMSAHALIDAAGGWPARPAAVGGFWLVSWLAAAVAAVVAGRAAGRISPKAAVGGLGVLAAVWAGLALWGDAQLRGAPTRVVRIAAVQTDIPQDNRMDWTFRRRLYDWAAMRALIIEAGSDASWRPEVIALPEGLFPGRTLDPVALEVERESGAQWPTADEGEGLAVEVPGDFVAATTVADELLVLQRAVGVPLVVGGTAFEGFSTAEERGRINYGWEKMFNTAFSVEGGRVTGWYDKMRLAPFGEVMPYISAWPWLERRLLAIGARGMSFGLSAGERAGVLEFGGGLGGGLAVATPICYEMTDGGTCRALVYGPDRVRASVMVSISNDGWFGQDVWARRAFAQAGRWRCVELGVPMVRSANTGISGAYDRFGQMVAERVSGAGVVRCEVGAVEPWWRGTVFGRGGGPLGLRGGWAGWGSAVLVAAMVGLGWWGRRGKDGAVRA